MSSKRLHRWYQDVLSGYREAVLNGTIFKDDLHIKQKGKKLIIRVPIRKPEHLGKYMAIDEKNIDGSTYTILSNRETGKIALMAKTLKTNLLAELLKGMNNFNVRSLTRDMAMNYDWLGRQVFMNAYHVIDKFHVIKHALDALQSIRIRYRQIELTKRREYKKNNPKNKYFEVIYENGDSTLQLLARARGLLYKNKHEWTDQQKQRSQRDCEGFCVW